ncbi:protein kintoun [Siniperca chuatsi]|uniref:protein kintoun n=1 Tax=Siniperca chuatsi TaxID=119488 RepID=UPI001CE1ACCC|nr:protein kintoun [Siniperca chuatsi]
MEVGDKLKELNMTVDEIDRLSKALKDEKFREMLRDYAQELADPENKKRYEEEIKLLEQERGNTIEFIHPEPFRALRTSVNSKQKCFINICANEKVGKPESKWGVSEEGRRGQCWSLPHSLHPGRQDTDPKGNKIMIYDVIFHPDTLYIASKNKRFMDMVDTTAMQGIQNAFKVTLDKNNVREMSTKYKGTPQPCVIRKPIPGYKTKGPSEKPDPLAFPYPDDQRPTTPSRTKPTESPATKNSSDAKPKSFQIQPPKTEEPTKPNYTVKYRSFIDIQDFRCSRDSAQSPRPKEIVVTIDLPLLKMVADASLEVKEGRLLLESKKPAYRLELPLSYPVDEDKGEAKFNKQRGQLTVTLPVLPSNEAFDFAVGPAASVSDGERQEEKSEVEEEEKWKQKEWEGQNSAEEEKRGVEGERDTEEEDLKQQTWVEKGEEKKEQGREKGEEQMRGGQEGVAAEERVVGEKEKLRKQEREGRNSEVEEIGVGVAKWKKQIRKGQECVEDEKLQENEKEVGKFNPQKRQQHEDKGMNEHNTLREDGCDTAVEKRDSGVASFQCDTVDQCMDVSAEEENSCVASPESENQPVLITAEHKTCKGKEGEVNLNSEMKTSDIKEETEKTKETLDGKVETDAAFLHHGSSEESQTTIAAVSSTPANTQSQNNIKDCCISQGTEESSKGPATDEANRSSRGGPGSRVTLRSEELATGSVKPEERENVDEDDLPTEQILQNPEHDSEPPPVLLREIDKDGNETIISDHSTSAGIIFQNSLIYELD